MNYRFGFVLTGTKDYLRKIDLSYMDFIKENHQTDLRINFDSNGILYIEEDVNMSRSDQLMKLLKDNNVDTTYVSTVRWKDFPKVS